MKKQEELKKIREERKKHNKKDNPHIQRRRVEIIEYDDGNYSLIGFAWNLQLKKDEIKDAIESWVDGSLENGIDIGIKFNKNQ